MGQLNGLLNLLKAPGPTSHWLVGRIRRLWPGVKVGHGGTLDPLAAGVLLILLGKGTRLAEFMLEKDKVYRAEITFGVDTDTYDAAGSVIGRRPAAFLKADLVEVALANFRGRILQVPPPVSALKQGGRRLYQLARAGEAVFLPPRPVEVKELKLLAFHPGELPRATVEIYCSKGTYVRSLAFDLGQVLGTGAYISFLLRTQVGEFRLENAFTLEEIQEASASGAGMKLVQPLEEMVNHLPKIELSLEEGRIVSHGRMPERIHGTGTVRLLEPDGRLAAIARDGGDGFKLARVFPPEEE